MSALGSAPIQFFAWNPSQCSTRGWNGGVVLDSLESKATAPELRHHPIDKKSLSVNKPAADQRRTRYAEQEPAPLSGWKSIAHTLDRMSHLEDLLFEWHDWQGYVVKRNVNVGRIKHGGWAGELDMVATTLPRTTSFTMSLPRRPRGAQPSGLRRALESTSRLSRPLGATPATTFIDYPRFRRPLSSYPTNARSVTRLVSECACP